MPEVNAYLVPFSHADLFWLGAREECLSRGNRVISEALDMVEQHPEFRFLRERSLRELGDAHEVPYGPFEIVTVSIQWR